MSRNKGQRGQDPPLERRYGFFRCPSCNGHWESAQVYCIEDTDTAPYKQECKNCKTACLPYKVEDLKCPKCGDSAKECQGTCDDDDDDYSEADDFFDDDDEEHVDRQKPHRSDLCLKCRAGLPCV